MINRFVIAFFSALILNSCNEKPVKAEHGTWFGGQIINPISNSIILRKGDKIIAKPQLNQDNRFLVEISDFKPGLYEFLHKERQLIYLSEGDSIMIRVNTLEFDESLTYSGFGGAKNNFMIDLFLMNEKENEEMAREVIYSDNATNFQRYLDSLQKIRYKRWETFKLSHEVDTGFEDLAMTIIDYDIFARKEVYPLTSFIPSKMELISILPENFYDYRKNVSFDREDFLPLYSYQRFLFNYFNQAAFKTYGKHQGYDPNSFTHNYNELKIIDSVVSNDSIKSFLMTRNIRNYIFNSNNKEESGKMLERYMTMIPSSTDKKNIDQLYTRNRNLEAGKLIPEEIVLDSDLQQHSLRSLIKKPTILYFWSSENKDHMIRAHLRADKLRERYPDFDIMDFNMDMDEKLWLDIIEKRGFEKRYSFHFKDTIEELQEDFSINSIVKTIVINKNGQILNAHANMFSSRFEGELLGYLNTTN